MTPLNLVKKLELKTKNFVNLIPNTRSVSRFEWLTKLKKRLSTFVNHRAESSC